MLKLFKNLFQEDHSPQQSSPKQEVIVAYERRPLSRIEEDSLSVLNQGEFKPAKRALFRLIDNYIHDLANHYFINKEISNEDIILKFSQLKRAVEKARPKS